MEKDILDCWSGEDFEHNVAAALISVYETKIKRNKGSALPLKEKHLGIFRKYGPYIPGNGRVHLYGKEFDMVNDELPLQGVLGARGGQYKGTAANQYEGYFFCICFKKARSIPKGCTIRKNGRLYEYRIISASESHGIEGERNFFTVSNGGEITACDFAGFRRFGAEFGGQAIVRLSDKEPHILDEVELWASTALQFCADKRFCWNIIAEEGRARVTLGAEKEEIKSLLYARDLPQTATGRKRPVLHLVESHKRRLKSGTDIDITPFLRGTQKVEMGGTVFSVIPPLVRKPELSKNSQRFYV
jgi:hypothetical protein